MRHTGVEPNEGKAVSIDFLLDLYVAPCNENPQFSSQDQERMNDVGNDPEGRIGSSTEDLGAQEVTSIPLRVFRLVKGEV